MGRVITNDRLPRVAGFHLQLNDKILPPCRRAFDGSA
jgi:hypothetical protein